MHEQYRTVSIWDLGKCPLLRGCPLIRESSIRGTHDLYSNQSYSEEPEDVILFLPKKRSICVTRHSVAKQPETKGTSKNINVFL